MKVELHDKFSEWPLHSQMLAIAAALEAGGTITPEVRNEAVRLLTEGAGALRPRWAAQDKYDAIKSWRDQFDGYLKEPRAPEDYYRGMASGLTIALQEIDRERYNREAPVLPCDCLTSLHERCHARVENVKHGLS